MTEKIDVLIIDDDKFSQQVIIRALSDEYKTHTADDGESGIATALELIPDIILLDVEMPGLNGYEVCDRLRNNEATKKIPIIITSSHSTLRERMQGYEAGADDYLIKPFELQTLIAKIQVLLKYEAQQREMQIEYEAAQKTAQLAMTGSNEFGQSLLFMERSYAYRSFDALAKGLFSVTDWLGLKCCLQVLSPGHQHWFSSHGSVKPLEQELMEMVEMDKRFFDFGNRTIINFINARLLVKNMPLNDMERYGRLKDLLPMILSAVNAKVRSLSAEHALQTQTSALTDSLKQVKSIFFNLAHSLNENHQQGTRIMRNLLHDLNESLPLMGLDDDQEEYILDRIEAATQEAMNLTDAGDNLRHTFSSILHQLQEVVVKQEQLLDSFISSQDDDQATDNDQESYTMDVELF